LLIAIFNSPLRAQDDPVLNAENGITAAGSSTTRKAILGGTLTANTTITLGGFNLAFSGTGNVGIGTTSPGSLLDVNGASRFRNNITADFGTTNRRAQLRDNGLFMTDR
jgi:hypothetical protein